MLGCLRPFGQDCAPFEVGRPRRPLGRARRGDPRQDPRQRLVRRPRRFCRKLWRQHPRRPDRASAGPVQSLADAARRRAGILRLPGRSAMDQRAARSVCPDATPDS